MVLVKDRKKLLRQILRQAREDAKLRQIDVAALLGVPQSYVAKVESGERKISFIEVLDFCNAIGLDPQVLIDRLSS
jgi:transcriptional regulator with XRE-family HTH domain